MIESLSPPLASFRPDVTVDDSPEPIVPLPPVLIPPQRRPTADTLPVQTGSPASAPRQTATPAEVRLWATESGIPVNRCGPVPRLLTAAYLAADRSALPQTPAEAEQLAAAIRLWALQHGHEIAASEPIPYSLRRQYLAAGGGPVPPALPTRVLPQTIRRWARAQGIWIVRGSRIPLKVAALYAAKHCDPALTDQDSDG